MNFIDTDLAGVIIAEPVVLPDERGYFFELYQQQHYHNGNITANFVQDNVSRSTKNVVRGLHYQLENPQAKLVTVVEGVIFDVAVDIRPQSPTFKHWFGIELTADSAQQLFIPEGYAHGFCVISDTACIVYKVSDYYHADDGRTIRWDDPELAIDWPTTAPMVSKQDAKGVLLAELDHQDLPGFTL